MILDLTTVSAIKREKLRLMLELNQSYYGQVVKVRSVTKALVDESQDHWTFEFIGEDGKVHYYGMFENEIKRDVAKIQVEEVTPEFLIETIETEVRKFDSTIFCLRNKKRSHVVTFTTLVKKVRLDWKFVQYENKLVFASSNLDGFYMNIDRKVNDINSAMRVVNRMISDITICGGMKCYV